MSSGTYRRDTSVLSRLEAVLSSVRLDVCEADRKALLAQLCELLNEPELPESAREIGLEIAGKLARRTDGENACQSGLTVMIQRFRRRIG